MFAHPTVSVQNIPLYTRTTSMAPSVQIYTRFDYLHQRILLFVCGGLFAALGAYFWFRWMRQLCCSNERDGSIDRRRRNAAAAEASRALREKHFPTLAGVVQQREEAEDEQRRRQQDQNLTSSTINTNGEGGRGRGFASRLCHSNTLLLALLALYCLVRGGGLIATGVLEESSAPLFIPPTVVYLLFSALLVRAWGAYSRLLAIVYHRHFGAAEAAARARRRQRRRLGRLLLGAQGTAAVSIEGGGPPQPPATTLSLAHTEGEVNTTDKTVAAGETERRVYGTLWIIIAVVAALIAALLVTNEVLDRFYDVDASSTLGRIAESLPEVYLMMDRAACLLAGLALLLVAGDLKRGGRPQRPSKSAARCLKRFCGCCLSNKRGDAADVSDGSDDSDDDGATNGAQRQRRRGGGGGGLPLLLPADARAAKYHKTAAAGNEEVEEDTYVSRDNSGRGFAYAESSVNSSYGGGQSPARPSEGAATRPFFRGDKSEGEGEESSMRAEEREGKQQQKQQQLQRSGALAIVAGGINAAVGEGPANFSGGHSDGGDGAYDDDDYDNYEDEEPLLMTNYSIPSRYSGTGGGGGFGATYASAVVGSRSLSTASHGTYASNANRADDQRALSAVGSFLRSPAGFAGIGPAASPRDRSRAGSALGPPSHQHQSFRRAGSTYSLSRGGGGGRARLGSDMYALGNNNTAAVGSGRSPWGSLCAPPTTTASAAQQNPAYLQQPHHHPSSALSFSDGNNSSSNHHQHQQQQLPRSNSGRFSAARNVAGGAGGSQREGCDSAVPSTDYLYLGAPDSSSLSLQRHNSQRGGSQQQAVAVVASRNPSSIASSSSAAFPTTAVAHNDGCTSDGNAGMAKQPSSVAASGGVGTPTSARGSAVVANGSMGSRGSSAASLPGPVRPRRPPPPSPKDAPPQISEGAVAPMITTEKSVEDDEEEESEGSQTCPLATLGERSAAHYLLAADTVDDVPAPLPTLSPQERGERVREEAGAMATRASLHRFRSAALRIGSSDGGGGDYDDDHDGDDGSDRAPPHQLLTRHGPNNAALADEQSKGGCCNVLQRCVRYIFCATPPLPTAAAASRILFAIRLFALYSIGRAPLSLGLALVGSHYHAQPEVSFGFYMVELLVLIVSAAALVGPPQGDGGEGRPAAAAGVARNQRRYLRQHPRRASPSAAAVGIQVAPPMVPAGLSSSVAGGSVHGGIGGTRSSSGGGMGAAAVSSFSTTRGVGDRFERHQPRRVPSSAAHYSAASPLPRGV